MFRIVLLTMVASTYLMAGIPRTWRGEYPMACYTTLKRPKTNYKNEKGEPMQIWLFNKCSNKIAAPDEVISVVDLYSSRPNNAKYGKIFQQYRMMRGQGRSMAPIGEVAYPYRFEGIYPPGLHDVFFGIGYGYKLVPATKKGSYKYVALTEAEKASLLDVNLKGMNTNGEFSKGRRHRMVQSLNSCIENSDYVYDSLGETRATRYHKFIVKTNPLTKTFHSIYQDGKGGYVFNINMVYESQKGEAAKGKWYYLSGVDKKIHELDVDDMEKGIKDSRQPNNFVGLTKTDQTFLLTCGASFSKVTDPNTIAAVKSGIVNDAYPWVMKNRPSTYNEDLKAAWTKPKTPCWDLPGAGFQLRQAPTVQKQAVPENHNLSLEPPM